MGPLPNDACRSKLGNDTRSVAALAIVLARVSDDADDGSAGRELVVLGSDDAPRLLVLAIVSEDE